MNLDLTLRSGRLRDAHGHLVTASHELALRRASFWARTRLVVDVAVLAFAALIAYLLSPRVDSVGLIFLWPSLFAALVVYLLYLRGAYRRRGKLDTLDELRATVSVLGIATSLLVSARVLVEHAPQSAAGQSVKLGLIAAVGLAGGKVFVNLWQSQARRRGNALVPTLIIGAGNIGRTTARRLLEHPELGLKPIGFLDKEPLERNGTSNVAEPPVLGASWDFDRVAAEHGVGQVIVTFSTAPSEVLLRIVSRCEELGIAVALVPRLFEKVTERLTIEHLGGLPLVTSHPRNPKGLQFAIKYALDRVIALVMLFVLWPLLLLCAIAVWVSLGRPILFRQLRVGLDGRVFEMLKFRSMHPSGADDESRELPDDVAPGGVDRGDRLTKVGAFLRNTSLDELPQLLNVLKGEMSLVGPRPERPEFVELFEPRVHRYYDRHRIKAGITGWAQVNGLRGRTSLSDRVEWDNYYIENASLWLDLKIVGRTLREFLPRRSR